MDRRLLASAGRGSPDVAKMEPGHVEPLFDKNINRNHYYSDNNTNNKLIIVIKSSIINV